MLRAPVPLVQEVQECKQLYPAGGVQTAVPCRAGPEATGSRNEASAGPAGPSAANAAPERDQCHVAIQFATPLDQLPCLRRRVLTGFPLFEAAASGDSFRVMQLLRNGIDPRESDRLGRMPGRTSGSLVMRSCVVLARMKLVASEWLKMVAKDVSGMT
eukprot:Skav222856  [mRNA]  locus=scaffold850:665157:665630:- [translate_table: standard]